MPKISTSSRVWSLTLAALTLMGRLALAQSQAPAYLGPDASFGTNGSANTGVTGLGGRFSTTGTPQHETLDNMGQLVQANGHLWVCGGTQLKRYSPDGAPDTAFGVNGVATTPFTASGMAVQPDGNVVVVGHSPGFPYNTLALARYSATGVLDPTFGTAGVVSGSNSSGTNNIELRRVVQLASGQYLAFGTPSYGYGTRVLRFSATGQRDTGYSQNSPDWLEELTVQADGRIVLIGCEYNTLATRYGGISVRRLTAAGDVDTSFGTNGKTVINAVQVYQGRKSEAFTEGYGVAVQPADGKIVLAGAMSVVNLGDVPVLLRLNAGGSPDTTFNQATARSLPFYGGLRAVAVQADGALVVAGNALPFPGYVPQVAMARYAAAGTLDPTFAHTANGVYLQTLPSSQATATALAVQASGQLVTLGGFETMTGAAPSGEMRLARYLARRPTATRAASSRLGLQASPVPSNGLVQLHYTLPQAATVRYVLHDQLGRPVPGIAAGQRQAAGPQEHTLDLRTLAAGVYLCTVEAAGYRQTLRLVVAP